MNDKKLFESGCFSPEWATDMEQSPISTFYTRQNKDLQTLLNELDENKRPDTRNSSQTMASG